MICTCHVREARAHPAVACSPQTSETRTSGSWSVRHCHIYRFIDNECNLGDHTSAFVLAETLVRSPRFVVFLDRIKVLQKCFIEFWKQTHWTAPVHSHSDDASKPPPQKPTDLEAAVSSARHHALLAATLRPQHAQRQHASQLHALHAVSPRAQR